MRLSLCAIPLLLIGCASTPTRESKAVSSEARRYLEDYSRSDASSGDALPILLEACSGDISAMRKVFSHYDRFGSGDNEAWGDVPDVILRETGDKRYANFVVGSESDVRLASLRWLGAPGSTLFEDSELSRSFPRTSRLQEAEFASLEAREAKYKNHNKSEIATPRKLSD